MCSRGRLRCGRRPGQRPAEGDTRDQRQDRARAARIARVVEDGDGQRLGREPCVLGAEAAGRVAAVAEDGAPPTRCVAPAGRSRSRHAPRRLAAGSSRRRNRRTGPARRAAPGSNARGHPPKRTGHPRRAQDQDSPPPSPAAARPARSAHIPASPSRASPGRGSTQRQPAVDGPACIRAPARHGREQRLHPDLPVRWNRGGPPKPHPLASTALHLP